MQRKYTSDWYTEQPRDYVLYNRALTSDATKSGLSVGVGAQVVVPNAAEFDPNRRYDCLIWFYMPEFLKQIKQAILQRLVLWME